MSVLSVWTAWTDSRNTKAGLADSIWHMLRYMSQKPPEKNVIRLDSMFTWTVILRIYIYIQSFTLMFNCVNAEHSMYRKAPIFCFSSSPSLWVMWRDLGSVFDEVNELSRRSTWVPTSTISASGKYLFNSGIHLVLMFSIESGRTTL